MRTLKQGHKGNDVRLLQYKLDIEADGVFGPATKSALMEFQRKNGLVADGMCGPISQKALNMSDFIVDIVDPKKVRFIGSPYGASTKPLRTLKEWANYANIPDARYVLNLAYFNMTGSGRDEYGIIKGRTITYVKGQGKDIGYGGTEVMIHPNSDNACSGYKVGVYKGKKKTVSSIGQRAKNANGMLKDGAYFHVQSVTKCTEAALVNYMMKNYPVETLLIQDGGGSVGRYDIKNDVLLAPEKEGMNGRPVATVVMF